MFPLRLLAALALVLATVVSSHAWEGLFLDNNHSRLKDIIQKDYHTEEVMTEAIDELAQLVETAEQRFGRNSVQVGILLLDIGEGTIRRALQREGEQRVDGLNRGIRALTTGLPLVQPAEQAYADATVSRARGYFIMGRAYAALGEKQIAEDTYREALAVHWRRFDDAYWQLQVFDYLYEVLETPEERIELAYGRLKIANNLFGSGHVTTDAAEAMLRKAQASGNSLGDQFDLARSEAEALADAGDQAGAYQRLGEALALATNDTDRTLLIARIKPSPFLMYDDPEATEQIGWNEMQERTGLTAYDAVATRFLVDNSLEPFTAEGRNILLVLTSLVRKIHASGDRDLARYFCRLVPGYGYGYGDDGNIPDQCVATLDWANWIRSMGDAGGAIAILEMGLDLLEPSADAEEFRLASLQTLLSLETDYGSPDSFFRSYERVLDAGYKPRADFQVYAQIITDNSIGLETVFDEGLALWGDNEISPAPVNLMAKLALAGPSVSRWICGRDSGPDLELVRVSMCVSAGMDDQLQLDAAAEVLSAATGSGTGIRMVDDTGAAVQMVSGAPMLAIAKQEPIRTVMQDRTTALAPASYEVFTPRPLSPVELDFLDRPTSLDAFFGDKRGRNPMFDDDFDPALLAQALQQAGHLDLARGWAQEGIRRYAADEPPQTIFTAYLAEDFAQSTYEAGWRWLMLDYPILAEASFSDAIPDSELSYSRAAENIEAGSLEWERVIGAYHGRMLTRQALGDMAGARADALSLISYVQFILELQSFSRFETRDLIARVARPVLAHALSLLGSSDAPDGVDAAFRAIQLMANNGTSATAARLGARLSIVSAGLDDLARRREDLLLAWRAETGTDDIAVARRAELAADLDRIDRELAEQFPDYVDLAGSTVVPLAAMQALLAPGEVQLSYAVLDDAIAISAITADQTLFELVEIDSQDLAYAVADMRRGLEIRAGRLPLFRADAAFSLYQALVAPVEARLAAPVTRMIVMPDAAIGSIPFSVLVTDEARVELADTSWLSERYVISRIPSAGSFVLLRGAQRETAAEGTFVGIGDPLLDGDPGQFRGVSVSDVYSTRDGGVDVDSLRALPRLAETADELRSIETLVAPNRGLMLLGDAATETNVKAVSLSNYSVVAFATHGLVAGELQHLQEPGLVLTPPANSSDLDNGYLGASEIAQLRLNARLVLLSACNTAAPDAIGAEGLSGLAKSFFFAGARSLLVSHWSVETRAALELTTRMMTAHGQDADIGYADALNQAMKQLRAEADFNHPALWGAFEIVGN